MSGSDVVTVATPRNRRVVVAPLGCLGGTLAWVALFAGGLPLLFGAGGGAGDGAVSEELEIREKSAEGDVLLSSKLTRALPFDERWAAGGG